MLLIIICSIAIGAVIGYIFGGIVTHNKDREVVDRWQKKMLTLQQTAKTSEELHCIASAMDALFEVYREI